MLPQPRYDIAMNDSMEIDDEPTSPLQNQDPASNFLSSSSSSVRWAPAETQSEASPGTQSQATAVPSTATFTSPAFSYSNHDPNDSFTHDESSAAVSSSEPGPSRTQQLPYHPVPYPLKPPHLRTRLHAAQDLISRTNILPAYDEFVRPFNRLPSGPAGMNGVPLPGGGTASHGHPETPLTATEDLKGKGREIIMGGNDGQVMTGIDGSTAPPTANSLPGAAAVADDGEKKKKKKHVKGWQFLVSSKVSGKISAKKDTYYNDLLKAPDRQRVDIRQFDRSALNGFVLLEGQLDPMILQSLGLGPEEEKKKKKKLKKPEGQADNGVNGVSSPPLVDVSNPPLGGPTPYSQTQSPRIISSLQPNQPRVSTPLSASFQQQQNSYPSYPSTPNPGVNGANKVTKVRKDRDDGSPLSASTNVSGGATVANGQGPPRPHKKRKVDGQSPAPVYRPQQAPIQQATPT